MYETIFIPTDGGSDAMKGAKQGVELAAALDARVHGLYVVEEGTNPWEAKSIDDQRDRAEAYALEVVGEVGVLADEAGVEFVEAVRFGPHVYEVINDYVEEADVDLIAMGSGYRGEFGGLFGSTADKVLRTAHVPVLVVRRELREKTGSDKAAAAA